MNILWLSHIVPYPPKGGVLQRSHNLLKELAKHHSIYLISFDQDAKSRPIEEFNEAIEELSKICKSVETIPIPCDKWKYGKYYLSIKSIFTSYPYTLNWLYSKEMKKRIHKVMAKIKIDLVHFDTISLAVYYDLVGDCKKALNHHNIESHMMLRRARLENQIIKKLYFFQEGIKIQHYEKKLCGNFDINITCSKLDSDRLMEIVPNLHVEDIPNGVDLEYFRPLNLEKEINSLIFVGGMGYYPNRNAMLFFAKNIWPLLKKEIPDVKVTIIGRYPPYELINISKYDNNFRITGFVNDVRTYIDRAMVYICPIQDGGGTKLKILDALAMGKAIVADPIACEGIDVIDQVTVLFAKFPSDYVEKIQFLFKNPYVIEEIGRRSIMLVEEKYSFKKIGNRFSQLYDLL